jgi:hypothetical protein
LAKAQKVERVDLNALRTSRLRLIADGAKQRVGVNAFHPTEMKSPGTKPGLERQMIFGTVALSARRGRRRLS